MKVLLSEEEVTKLQDGSISIDEIIEKRNRNKRTRARELYQTILDAIDTMDVSTECKDYVRKAWIEYVNRGKKSTTMSNEEGKKLFFDNIRIFLEMAETAKQFNPETKTFNGIMPEELKSRIDPGIYNFLITNHYISVNPGKQVWFAYNNPKYPDHTISTLQNMLYEYDNSL